MTIVPAILSENFEDIARNLFAVEGIAKVVQIDISDGIVGKKRTWTPTGDELLPLGFVYEFDLMVKDWRDVLPRCLLIGAKRVVMHVDSFVDQDIDDVVQMVKGNGVALGISVSNTTPLPFLITAVRLAQSQYSRVFVQMMGIRMIGVQGEPFDEEVLERIRVLHQEFPSMSIQIDGSMNDKTIKRVRRVGADTAVVGSFLFKSKNIHEALLMLEHLAG